jgi:glycosyltransferase involved in cell wall biosynthesis
MNVLFAHQNFPGQFLNLAPALVRRGHDVRAITLREGVRDGWRGVGVIHARTNRMSSPSIHPWLADFETKVIRGDAFHRAARALKATGYVADVIIAHPGYGEALFLKEVWPDARLGLYAEFFHQWAKADVGFDPEFPAEDPDGATWMRLRNLNYRLLFDETERGLAPTRWQADQFPDSFRSKIDVIHEGVKTAIMGPDPDASVTFASGLTLRAGDEVITYVSRNLEPFRGYHIFMRALPAILRRRPKARVVILGADAPGYGPHPPEGSTWARIFHDEIAPQLTPQEQGRIHRIGWAPTELYRRILQISAVHVYLTYPFVLSWSLIEAMSVGCAIVAGDTAPVREAITPDVTGRLVDFFDVAALAEEVCALLDDPARRRRMGTEARNHVIQTYDCDAVCLPRQLAWVDRLAA